MNDDYSVDESVTNDMVRQMLPLILCFLCIIDTIYLNRPTINTTPYKSPFHEEMTFFCKINFNISNHHNRHDIITITLSLQHIYNINTTTIPPPSPSYLFIQEYIFLVVGLHLRLGFADVIVELCSCWGSALTS